MFSNIDDSQCSSKNFEFDEGRLATEDETANWLLDDGPVLKTTWMIYDRQFPDGQREICATRSVRIKKTGSLPMPNRSKRGDSEKRGQNDEDSAKRAKQAVRLRCKAIAVDRMLTLTYRENMQDTERLKKDWDLFRRRMGEHKDFHYVATVERQERGAFHIHVAVHGRQVYQLIRAIWQKIVGLSDDGKQGGQINVRDPHRFGFGKHGAHKLAGYISKYISKDQDTHELNKKRYWSSRGIVVPEKNYYQLPYGTDAFDAFSHVMQLGANHNNEGMAFFANQALGVCWVATAPQNT
ncbi:rolling circle replication-associated protein [Undibacterium danionis]|uniref:Replication-associated protein ORF2/G2P domain-containing protein n=1 Tax=Undibacterium danionis TaxID=1812100 RepID=A0ABV6IC31_9BURK